MSQERANCKHKCEQAAQPEKDGQDCLSHSLLMNHILVYIKLHVTVVGRVLFSKFVCVATHMLSTVENRPVVDGCLTEAEHLLNMLVIRLEPLPLHRDTVCLSEGELEREPVQV